MLIVDILYSKYGRDDQSSSVFASSFVLNNISILRQSFYAACFFTLDNSCQRKKDKKEKQPVCENNSKGFLRNEVIFLEVDSSGFRHKSKKL